MKNLKTTDTDIVLLYSQIQRGHFIAQPLLSDVSAKREASQQMRLSKEYESLVIYVVAGNLGVQCHIKSKPRLYQSLICRSNLSAEKNRQKHKVMASQAFVLHGIRSPTQGLRSTRGMDSLAQATLWFLKYKANRTQKHNADRE